MRGLAALSHGLRGRRSWLLQAVCRSVAAAFMVAAQNALAAPANVKWEVGVESTMNNVLRGENHDSLQRYATDKTR